MIDGKPSRPLPAVQTTLWRARDGSLHESQEQAISHLLTVEIETALKPGGASGYVDRGVKQLLAHFHVWRIGDPSPVVTPPTTEQARAKEVCKKCLLLVGFVAGASFTCAGWWLL